MFIYSNIHYSLIVHLFEQSDIDIDKIIYDLKMLKVSILVEDSGIEPLTSWMQIRRSPSWANPPKQWWAEDDSNVRPHPYQGCALTTWATGPYVRHFKRREMRTVTLNIFFDQKKLLVILRKEVIQPQVPLRLPCYDFTPVADRTVVKGFKLCLKV